MEYNSEEQIQQFKLKRMIKMLDTAVGTGTSMITVIIPPGKKVSDIQKMLGDEAGKAEKIKDRVNRQSVIRAITYSKERLKNYNKIPDNGLFIYSGEIITQDGKGEGKLIIDFEPFKAINTTLYKCNNTFITEPLKDLLASSDKYGFIIVDGLGTLYGTLQGNTRNIINKFSVDLPKKHGRGGQSCQRFGRIREEKRHAYVRKVSEHAVPCFIENDLPNVAGLVIAGYADFKNLVAESQFFDQRLKKIIVNIADISYGGEQGFNQAIALSAGCFANIKMVQEQQLIGKFYEEINMDTGKIVYGILDTMRAISDGIAEKVIAFDNLEMLRLTVKEKEKDTPIVKYVNAGEEFEIFMSKEGEDYDLLENVAVIDWLAENHKSFGAELVFVTDCSPEGNQFLKGFGGIGAFLRYKWDGEYQYYDMGDDDSDDDFI